MKILTLEFKNFHKNEISLCPFYEEQDAARPDNSKHTGCGGCEANKSMNFLRKFILNNFNN